eukprot:56657-Hanusia_phi.AAC.1
MSSTPRSDARPGRPPGSLGRAARQCRYRSTVTVSLPVQVGAAAAHGHRAGAAAAHGPIRRADQPDSDGRRSDDPPPGSRRGPAPRPGRRRREGYRCPAVQSRRVTRSDGHRVSVSLGASGGDSDG